jgi:hypothetical protein
MSEFIRIFNEVSRQVEESVHRNTYFEEVLNTAIDAWCDRLPLDNQQEVRNGIKKKVRQRDIEQLIEYHYEDGQKRFFSSCYPDLINRILVRLLHQEKQEKQEKNNMKFIVLIAFATVAVGFVIYLLNQPKQQPQQRSYQTDDSPPPPARRSTPTPSRPPVATVTKQCLILVIDAAHGDIVESIRSKGRIEPEDCTLLYEATKCLSMKPENGLTQFSQVINQDRVSPGEESEFDVYLVKIELRNPDAGLGGNVDNQLDRQDAFNRLPQLAAANIQVSQRLRMEAAERFDVYYR